MAGDAAFDLRCGMFKYKRAALFNVALHARLRPIAHQRKPVGGTVRIVAVRTFERALGNAMMRGQRELRLDVAVALIAEFGLRLHQLTVVQPAILFPEPGHVEEIALSGTDG